MSFEMKIRHGIAALFAAIMMLLMPTAYVYAQDEVEQVTLHYGEDRVTVSYLDGTKKELVFYGPNIFRVFQTADGSTKLRDPKADPPAEILVADAKKEPGMIDAKSEGDEVIISTKAIKIVINRNDGCMKVFNMQIPVQQRNVRVSASVCGATSVPCWRNCNLPASKMARLS